MVRVMEEEDIPPCSFDLLSFHTIRLGCTFADFLRNLIPFIVLKKEETEEVEVSFQECSLNSV